MRGADRSWGGGKNHHRRVSAPRCRSLLFVRAERSRCAAGSAPTTAQISFDIRQSSSEDDRVSVILMSTRCLSDRLRHGHETVFSKSDVWMSLCAVYFRTSAIVALLRALFNQEDAKNQPRSSGSS